MVAGIGAVVAATPCICFKPAALLPEQWDGMGSDFTIAQHVNDVIGFIEVLGGKPADVMGHSRGGHIAFRVA